MLLSGGRGGEPINPARFVTKAATRNWLGLVLKARGMVVVLRESDVEGFAEVWALHGDVFSLLEGLRRGRGQRAYAETEWVESWRVYQSRVRCRGLAKRLGERGSPGGRCARPGAIIWLHL